MKLRVMAIALAMVVTAYGSAMAQAPGGEIGIYSDTAGSSCIITANVYTQTLFYILAKPNLANTDGVNGAEFRVSGLWVPVADGVLTATPNPASSVALGNPFYDPATTPTLASPWGCNIAFGPCQMVDANGFVMLYTVSLVAFNAGIVTEKTLDVEARNPPSNAQANFALITKCDPPTFTALQAAGGRAYVNVASPGGCQQVAVESATWSSIKTLYN